MEEAPCACSRRYAKGIELRTSPKIPPNPRGKSSGFEFAMTSPAQYCRDLFSRFTTFAREWLGDRPQLFDSLHLAKSWDVDSPVERRRYERILTMVRQGLGREDLGEVFEVGCSEAAFTEAVAPGCRSVTTGDISFVALARARERCARFANVTVIRWDLCRDQVPGSFDVVFAMDVLDYIHGPVQRRRVMAKLARAVRPGGFLAISVCRLKTRASEGLLGRVLLGGGLNLLDWIDGHHGLALVAREYFGAKEEEYPGYMEHALAVYSKRTG